MSLEFLYDEDNSSPRVRQLGRLDPPDYYIASFKLDGAGGETIESIEVAIQRVTALEAHSFAKHGVMRSIKVR